MSGLPQILRCITYWTQQKPSKLFYSMSIEAYKHHLPSVTAENCFLLWVYWHGLKETYNPFLAHMDWMESSGNSTCCILTWLFLFYFSHLHKIWPAELDKDTKLTQWLSHLFITNAGPNVRDGFREGIWNEKKWKLLDAVTLLPNLTYL
jgi:hypothetical protein